MFSFRKQPRAKKPKPDPFLSFAVLFFAYNRDIVAGPPPLTGSVSDSYALSLKPLKSAKGPKLGANRAGTSRDASGGRPVSVQKFRSPPREKVLDSNALEAPLDS